MKSHEKQLYFYEPCGNCKLITKKLAVLEPNKKFRYDIFCSNCQFQRKNSLHVKDVLKKFITTYIYQEFEGKNCKFLIRLKEKEVAKKWTFGLVIGLVGFFYLLDLVVLGFYIGLIQGGIRLNIKMEEKEQSQWG